jgi:hypothetical protein
MFGSVRLDRRDHDATALTEADRSERVQPTKEPP